jgi:hypothetical protein
VDEGYDIVAVERDVGQYNQESVAQFTFVDTRTELEDVVLEVAQCSLDIVLHVEELAARPAGGTKVIEWRCRVSATSKMYWPE